MTLIIIISLVCGILSGYLFTADWFAFSKIAESFVDSSGTVLTVGLCVLLFFVGLDIGIEGTAIQKFKKVGWRVIVIPFGVMAGTLSCVALASLFLPISLKEALAVGSGFGWYSLAPVILADYSAKISAVSLLHNVCRDVIAIICIPLVAKKIGQVETVSLPGASAMDVCLPIVERATSSDIAIYSFISGFVITIAVPILVPFFMTI